MRKQLLTGTHYEVGTALGESLDLSVLPPYPPSANRLARRCRELVAGLYPPALEKLQGIIDASGLSAELVENHYFVKGMPVQGCASFVVLPGGCSDGAPLVARAYHWLLSDRRWCVLRETHVKGTFASLSYTHHWVGLTDVMNEKGLYCGVFGLPGESSRKAAVQWHTIVDMVMETCGRVPEAVKLMASVPHFRCLGYILADAEGNAAVVEADPEKVYVRSPSRDMVAATNHYICKDIALQNRPRSVRVYKRVIQLLEACHDKVTVEDAWRILADHESGICRGEHDPAKVSPDSFGTLYALVARPQGRGLVVSPGHPCKTEYVQATFEGSEVGS